MKKKPLIIAHRGESFDAPENTLAAVNLAWQRNADAVEVDVHLTKDNHVIVIHDPNTKRIGNQNKKIKDSTLDEIKQVIVEDNKCTNEKIPTLNEVLSSVPFLKKILVEIKTGNKIIPPLVNLINNSNLETNQIEFIGFDFRTMAEVKNFLPQHNVLWILKLERTWSNKFFHPSIKKIILKAKENNIDGLDLWAGKNINTNLIREIKTAGLLVYLWTADDPEKIRSYIEMGVDGITTNRAGWIKSKLGLN